MTAVLDADHGSRRVGRRLAASLFGRLLFSARFMTIWIATAMLLVVTRIIAPETLSSTSWSTMLPIASVLAMVAIGQMLVVMMGGIDLSMGATISLLANILVGVAQGSEDRLIWAIVVTFFWAAVIGLTNGLLVGGLDLNPLIVTLATGLVLSGITAEYRLGTANSTSVPDGLARVVFERVFGISKAFWFVLVVTVVVGFVLRSTKPGRRFQAVGANRRASWVAGIRVRSYVVVSYMLASIAGGVAAIVLSAIIDNPGIDPGASYLLAPVAAVVLAGASLSGGLASTASTWLAAFFVVVLNQMLRVLGLSTAVQPIVFALAIVLGMLISGDRIAELVGRLLIRHPGLRAMMTEAMTAESAPRPEAAPTAPGAAEELR